MTGGAVDLVIHGGTVVNATGRVAASVAIEGGKIAAIGPRETMPEARETIDARGRYVLPGAIDAHVHFREPGLEYKEDWGTGTAAAAAGGVTTVFEMPNTDPPTDAVETFALKERAAAAQAVVDYGIYGLLGEDNLDQLKPLAAAGAIGFKLFLGNTTGNLPCPSDGAVLEGFEILAGLGLRCTVHAENSPILFRREARMKAAGRKDVLAHLAARPDVCALEALNRTAIFAEWTGARVHIAHESTRRSLPFIRDAKARGVDLTVETCPQYFLLSTDDMLKPGGAVLRVNPPIREPGQQEPLFEALLDGTIDMLSTDHAPHLPSEKDRASIWDCSCGFPGVETSMRLMLDRVNGNRLTLEEYVRMACTAPARAFGLYPRKGVLAPGSDADIAIVDLAREETILAEKLHSRSKVTPYHGRRVRGVPVMTLVRGRVVMKDGEVVGPAGWGRRQRPAMAPGQVRNPNTTMDAIVVPGNRPY
ncbi:MAG TPA: allantoinase AllB [Alphaproteobacteria bacterium]|nr:allantoinase AllB [Alphaproteobacteria bacterium]